MTRAGPRWRRLCRDTQAVVVVEFALALPLLLIMYVGATVVADAMSCKRKVAVTTRALTDMTSRYRQLDQATTLPNILMSAQVILKPYNFTNATVTMSEVSVVDATHVQVVWTETMTNGVAPTSAKTFPLNGSGAASQISVPSGLIPDNLVPVSTNGKSPGSYCDGSANAINGTPAGCMILGQVTYNYLPPIGFADMFNFGGGKTLPLSDSIYLQPRYSPGITLCSSAITAGCDSAQ